MERTGRKERTAILRPSGGKVISFAEVVIHLREAGLVEGRGTNVGDEIVVGSGDGVKFAAGQNCSNDREMGSVTEARSASVGTRALLTVGAIWRKPS